MKLVNEDFHKLIEKGIHIVDFYATWCGPCKMISPILEELESEIDIIKVDVDEHADIASEYGIMSIPTLLYIKDGKVVESKLGFDTKENILEHIKKLKEM